MTSFQLYDDGLQIHSVEPFGKYFNVPVITFAKCLQIWNCMGREREL